MIKKPNAFPLIVTASLVLSLSCRYGPARVNQPSISAAGAGKGALELYDTNGDGLIGGDELEKAPALKAALQRLDTNADKSVDANEVAARINAWKTMRTGMASVRCHITLDGQPLSGAEVIFEPEPFLGDAIKIAKGTTNQFGDAAPTIAKEDRPHPSLPGGMHFGLYKVCISKKANNREIVPARYNTETILGQEISYDDPGMINNNMAFNLKSK